MKKFYLIILSTFVTCTMLPSFDNKDTYIYAQEKVDRNIIPLLIPPYKVISEFQSADMNEMNVTYINNKP